MDLAESGSPLVIRELFLCDPNKVKDVLKTVTSKKRSESFCSKASLHRSLLSCHIPKPNGQRYRLALLPIAQIKAQRKEMWFHTARSVVANIYTTGKPTKLVLMSLFTDFAYIITINLRKEINSETTYYSITLSLQIGQIGLVEIHFNKHFS